LETINFPDTLKYSNGLKSWKDIEFHESMNKCCRFWPHQNDTGGFFVAKLRKL